MCLAQGPQRSDAGEARTSSPQSRVKHSTTEPLRSHYLEEGPLMWMMPLHLHVNQNSDYDDNDDSVWQIKGDGNPDDNYVLYKRS